MSEAPRGRRAGSAPTIYDVAREAGVAPSTVSRAFSRPGRVNAETAERVRAVAAQLGYRTNPPARALSTGRSSMVALVIPDVTNPVYFDITRGAEDAAAEAGYTLVLADFRESGRLEREAIDRAVPAVAGLVLGGHAFRTRPSGWRPSNGRRWSSTGPSPTSRAWSPTIRAGCAAPPNTSGSSAMRPSPTWPGRRRRGPTGCGGARCGRPHWSSTCGYAASVRTHRRTPVGWPRSTTYDNIRPLPSSPTTTSWRSA